MIRSLSPYYVSTPLISPNTGLLCSSYTLYIKVWDGDRNSPPNEVTYQLTKDNDAFLAGSDKIDIARLVSDFIEFTPQSNSSTGIIDGNNQKWIQYYNTYETSDPADATTPQNMITDIMSLGYSYGNEGENNNIVSESNLIPTQEYKVYRKGIFIVPILLDESGVAASAVTIKSYPNNQINISQNISGTSNSSELVKYVWIDLNDANLDRYVEVTYKDAVTTLYIEDECRYNPINIVFQNKDGAEQNITFFKERTESMSVTNSVFERGGLQASDGFHQFVKYNIQGQSSFKANSGYIDEITNEVFRQMLLSEKLWIYENDQFTPVNIKSRNISYKTRQKDRLINYEIEFIKSYNEINNI